MSGFFTRRILRGKAHQIFLMHGIDHTGKNAWYYLFVPEHKEQAFMEASNRSMPFTLTDYGNVLESGYGEFPPAEVTARMHAEYAE